MNQIEIEREIKSHDEKIALAELEASKAAERVKELQYSKARYLLDVFNIAAKAAAIREQEKAQNEQVQNPPR